MTGLFAAPRSEVKIRVHRTFNEILDARLDGAYGISEDCCYGFRGPVTAENPGDVCQEVTKSALLLAGAPLVLRRP